MLQKNSKKDLQKLKKALIIISQLEISINLSVQIRFIMFSNNPIFTAIHLSFEFYQKSCFDLVLSKNVEEFNLVSNGNVIH